VVPVAALCASAAAQLVPAIAPASARHRSIAFVRNGRLYFMRDDGRNQRSGVAEVDGFPVWSPNGRFIAFGNRSERSRIYIARADGSDRRGVTPTSPFDCVWMMWSPDARRLAYTRNTGCEGELAIFVINVDGSGRRRLAPPTSFDAVWSPGGRELLYARGRSAHLSLMRADGSGKRPLKGAREPEPLGTATRPFADWSRDGKRIFFIGPTRSYRQALFVVNLDGTHRRNLAPALYALIFSLSPNRRRIALSALLNGRRSIYVLPAGGGRPRNLTHADAKTIDGDPQWSQDGRKLLFTRQTAESKSQIYLVNADGSGLRNLSRKPGAADSAPTWQPG